MDKREKRLFYISSFILPVFLTLVLFAIRGICPFGNITFLKKDLYQQYLPFFYEYYRKLKAGESLWYSWNAGVGANFLAVIVYYLATPLNLLSVFFPEKYILEFITWSVIIKTGLMGLTSASYLSNHFKKYDYAMIFFSLCYSMSAYMAAYSWNIEWMDVLFIAPMVLKGIDKMMEDESPLTFYLSLSYAILTNYYLSIMLCIYAFLYFVGALIIKGFSFGRMIKFSVFSLLSGLTGAVMILPEYCALRFTTFTNIRFPKEVTPYLSLGELFLRHLSAIDTETGLGHSPNIYCGVLILILTGLYLFSESIPLKERLVSAALLLIFLLSFNLNILNFIWHGLNFPDSLPARQGYLYTLLLMCIAYEGYTKIKTSRAVVCIGAMAVPAALAAAALIFTGSEDIGPVTVPLNIIFFALYVLTVSVERFAPEKLDMPENSFSKLSAYSILILLMVELTLNMFFTNSRSIKRTDYFSKFDDYRVLNEEKNLKDKENDAPLNRADEIKRNVRNDSMMIGYSSLSYFSSTVNGLLIKNLNKYGFMNSRVFYLSDGSTAFTSMLYGLKYLFVPKDGLFSGDDTCYPYKFSNGALLLEKDLSLPNGYVLRLNDENRNKLFLPYYQAEKIIDSEIEAPNSDLTAAEAQNSLLHDLNISGTLLMSYGKNEDDTISREKGRVIISFTDDCHLYAYDNSKTEEELTVRYSDGTPEGSFTSNKYRYFYDMGYHKKGTTVSFISKSEKDEMPDLEFYKLNESVLSAFSDTVNKAEHLENIEVKDASLSGTIDMKSKGNLVLTIPYEPGWTLLVDGRKTDIDLFDGIFISADLSEGTHEIKLSFFPRGFKAGLIISLFALILALFLLKYEDTMRKRRFYRERRLRIRTEDSENLPHPGSLSQAP